MGLRNFGVSDTILELGSPLNREITDFLNGDQYTLETPNDISTLITGSNGNSASVENPEGRNGIITLRLLRHSSDDIFMMREFKKYKDNPSTYQPLDMSITEFSTGEDGDKVREITTMKAIFKARPEKKNTSDTEGKAVREWSLNVANIDENV